MRGMVGLGSHEFVTGISKEMEDWAMGRSLTVSVSMGRTVTLRRGPSRYANSSCKFKTGFCRVTYPIDKVAGLLLAALPRFGLHELEFVEGKDCLMATLPPVHELPEFSLARSHATRKEKLFAADEAQAEEARIRRDASLRAMSAKKAEPIAA